MRGTRCRVPALVVGAAAGCVVLVAGCGDGRRARSGESAQPRARQPETPIRIATVAPKQGERYAPSIAASGRTAVWTTIVEGRPALQVAVDGVLVASRVGLGAGVVDLSVGTSADGDDVVLFSRCPTGKHRDRVVGRTCDLFRLSSTDGAARVVPLRTIDGGDERVRGASTATADERAPALSGRTLVFSRWPLGSGPGVLVRRDVVTGRERALPDGPRGECRGDCSFDGRFTNGPIDTSVSGDHIARSWEYFGGPEAVGTDSATEVAVHEGDVGEPTVVAVGSIGMEGAGSFVSDVQQLGEITQMVLRYYEPESGPSTPGGHDTVLRVAGGKSFRYVDPAGRRIMSAAATASELWLILDARPLPGGTKDSEAPAACAPEVGGCVVERMPVPRFAPLRD